jgi:hypothetical protein
MISAIFEFTREFDFLCEDPDFWAFWWPPTLAEPILGEVYF